MNTAFGYFHSAPTNTPSPRYLKTRGKAAPGKPLNGYTGKQKPTMPNWNKVGETDYRHFDND
jgi:hypothetical protein